MIIPYTYLYLLHLYGTFIVLRSVKVHEFVPFVLSLYLKVLHPYVAVFLFKIFKNDGYTVSD